MPVGKVPSFMVRQETHRPEWIHVDAADQVLGRLAVRIAGMLMGKHKPTYTPHVDSGDFVVVTNCEKVKLTGNKREAMHYDRYSYYPGGFKRVYADEVLETHPDRVLRFAVKRMLPKNSLGRHMLKKLKIYAGDQHPHAAQQPRQDAN